MAKTQRIRVKPCDRCGLPAKALYRIRHQPEDDWLFACDSCRAKLAEGNPHYVYGGTWKSRKRH